MADELEVLEKQQLSAQRSLNDLTDQLTLADHLVYKKYLTELQNYGMVELSQQMLDVQDPADRKSTRLNSSHRSLSRMPSSA